MNIYREEILDHYQNPRNFGKIKDADVDARQTNPLCGDDIAIWIKFNDEKYVGVNERHLEGVIVGEIGFSGKGCAICLAAASMLTEHALGKTKGQLTKFSEEDMLSLLGVEISETRKKCALLALAVLKDCTNGIKSKS